MKNEFGIKKRTGRLPSPNTSSPSSSLLVSAFAALVGWCVAAAFEFKTHTHWRTRTHSPGCAHARRAACMFERICVCVRARMCVYAPSDCFTLSSLGSVILLTRTPSSSSSSSLLSMQFPAKWISTPSSSSSSSPNWYFFVCFCFLLFLFYISRPLIQHPSSQAWWSSPYLSDDVSNFVANKCQVSQRLQSQNGTKYFFMQGYEGLCDLGEKFRSPCKSTTYWSMWQRDPQTDGRTDSKYNSSAVSVCHRWFWRMLLWSWRIQADI